MSKFFPQRTTTIRSVETLPQYREREQKEGPSLRQNLESLTKNFKKKAFTEPKKGWHFGWWVLGVIFTLAVLAGIVFLSVELMKSFSRPSITRKRPVYKALLMLECRDPGHIAVSTASNLNSTENVTTIIAQFRPEKIRTFANGTIVPSHCSVKVSSKPWVLWLSQKFFRKA